jgi:hypothetical protein
VRAWRDNVGVPPPPTPRSTPSLNPRWALAEDVAGAVRHTYGSAVQAIGVHGSVARGDDTDASNVDIVVVARSPGTGPRPGARRIQGVIVDLGVITAEEYLRHARTLTTSWPLVAEQYLTARPLHDPDVWLPRLRDAHIEVLARTEDHTFASLAREAWCRAVTAHAKSRRLTEWYETDSAMLVLGEARLGCALVAGLLSRTYFRNPADAVRRAGVAAADLTQLTNRLTEQADELAQRGRPVDGEIGDLIG